MGGVVAPDKRCVGRRMKKKKSSLCLGLFRKISGVIEIPVSNWQVSS